MGSEDAQWFVAISDEKMARIQRRRWKWMRTRKWADRGVCAPRLSIKNPRQKSARTRAEAIKLFLV